MQTEYVKIKETAAQGMEMEKRMERTGILVVDDDKEIAELVEIHLAGDGFQVFKAYDAATGLKILAQEKIMLAILDIMLPGMDGIALCQKIREQSNIPIIMLSAKSTDLDKIVGLHNGADDYVSKPFHPLELTARVKSQLRRYTTLNPSSGKPALDREIRVQNLTMNRDTRNVTAYGREVKLTPIEFDILYLLASNAGRVFSTDEIFEQVWKEKMYEANNTVMVHIRRLREKIELDPKNAEIIKTVWGVGYRIEK